MPQRWDSVPSHHHKGVLIFLLREDLIFNLIFKEMQHPAPGERSKVEDSEARCARMPSIALCGLLPCPGSVSTRL